MAKRHQVHTKNQRAPSLWRYRNSDIGHPPPAAPTMGTCQSKRDLLPADSRHVMLGVTNDAEFKRRYSQEEELPPGYGAYRPSSLDEILDAMEEQGSGSKRILNKRSTMDTLRCSITSTTTLVEPTPECSLAA